MSILLFIAQLLIEVYWEPWDCPINQCFFAWMMCRELHHFFRRYLISMRLLFLLLLMLLLLLLMLEKDRLMISASPFYALLVADCFKCNKLVVTSCVYCSHWCQTVNQCCLFFWAQNQGISQFLIEVYWEPWDCPINQCLINQCWVVLLLLLLLLLLLWLLPLLLLLLLLLLLRIPLVFQQPFGKWPFADWCFCVVCVTYGSIAGITRTSFPWSCALPDRLPARLRANLNKSPLRLGRDMLVQAVNNKIIK